MISHYCGQLDICLKLHFEARKLRHCGSCQTYALHEFCKSSLLELLYLTRLTMKFSIVIVLLVGKKSLDLSFLLHSYPVTRIWGFSQKLLFRIIFINIFVRPIFSVLGYVHGSTLCSNYPRGGGGPDGYYERPPPKHCRAQSIGKWRPTYRIVRR